MFIAIEKSNYHKIGIGERVYLKGFDGNFNFRAGFGYIDTCRADSSFICINQYNQDIKGKVNLIFRKENVQIFIEKAWHLKTGLIYFS